MKRVLEVNVDDIGCGGVFSLVKSIVQNNNGEVSIDIASIERFENENNILLLAQSNCQVHFVGYEGNKMIKQIKCFINLSRLLRQHSYDCVHIHSDVANKLLVSGLASKLSRVPKIILHSHASGVDGKHRFMKRCFHAACRRLLKYIGTDFMSCSDLASQWMFPNICKANIRVLKNGVDLNRFRFDETKRAEIRTTLGVADKLVIGHVGRFAYQKNHDFLIDVFAQVKKQNANSILLLVGEGVLQNEIKAKVDALGLTESVIFYGTSTNVAELFATMDIFVLPSHFEGLPIVGVEAQAAGLPTIFSTEITREAKLLESTVYMPIDGNSAAEWAQAIAKMDISDRNLAYDTLKRSGFSIDDTVRNLLNIYTE